MEKAFEQYRQRNCRPSVEHDVTEVSRTVCRKRLQKVLFRRPSGELQAENCDAPFRRFHVTAKRKLTIDLRLETSPCWKGKFCARGLKMNQKD